MKNTLTSLALVAVAMGLTGCSSLKHLASKPPATVITVKAPLTIKRTFGGETILPAGDYRAALEDDQGFYYEAPGKILGKGAGSWQFDGGLYLRKGSTVPTHYYVIGRHNETLRYRLKVLPVFQSTP